MIGDRDGHFSRARRRGNFDRARRRELDCVFQQIDQHLLNEHVIEGNQWQIGRELRHDGMGFFSTGQAMQNDSHDFLKGLPFFIDIQAAPFDARHIEQVGDEPIQPLCFLVDRFHQLPARLRIEAAVRIEQGAARSGDRRQRRARNRGKRRSRANCAAARFRPARGVVPTGEPVPSVPAPWRSSWPKFPANEFVHDRMPESPRWGKHRALRPPRRPRQAGDTMLSRLARFAFPGRRPRDDRTPTARPHSRGSAE